jgi:hypothetical protein
MKTFWAHFLQQLQMYELRDKDKTGRICSQPTEPARLIAQLSPHTSDIFCPFCQIEDQSGKNFVEDQ